MEAITLANAKVGDTVIDVHKRGSEMNGWDCPESPYNTVCEVDEAYVYVRLGPARLEKFRKSEINPRFQLFDPLNVRKHFDIADRYECTLSMWSIQESMYKLTTAELKTLEKFLEDQSNLWYFEAQNANGT